MSVAHPTGVTYELRIEVLRDSSTGRYRTLYVRGCQMFEGPPADTLPAALHALADAPFDWEKPHINVLRDALAAKGL